MGGGEGENRGETEAPQNSLNSKALQMICLRPCDLQNTHSCWCHASQIRISLQKKAGDDENLQQCTVGREGQRGRGRGEAKRACCLPLLLLFGLWGLRWVSILHLFLPTSCLLSPALLFPLSPAFSSSLIHSLSLPVLSLYLSQGFNLWLWSSRNSDDNPRFPLLC